jgi:hypothetical protein
VGKLSSIELFRLRNLDQLLVGTQRRNLRVNWSPVLPVVDERAGTVNDQYVENAGHSK